MRDALRRHWPEYLMEAAGLGIFMISACGFALLLEHPASTIRQAIASEFVRRVLMGIAMGGTAVALIYSPWGRRSGAHYNPAVTFTFWRLGKVKAADALLYAAFQFVGGAAGIGLATLMFGPALANDRVNYVATLPGPYGWIVAAAAEVLIAFILMTVVLRSSNVRALARFTGVFAGTCVALFITFEAPVSGMSLNPARTFASALGAGISPVTAIYFASPLIGMTAAAWMHTRRRAHVGCAKLHHDMRHRCIFCGHPGMSASRVRTNANAQLDPVKSAS